MASAQSPALTARRKVRRLGKQQCFTGRRPTYGLLPLNRGVTSSGDVRFTYRLLQKGKHPGHQKQGGREADKQSLAALTEPRHRKKRVHL